MLVELSIVPLGKGSHISPEIAEVIGIVKEPGLPFQLTPAATCIEGCWDEVIPLIRRCHERVRERSAHVITTIKIEDEAGATNKLTENVASVQEKVAGSFKQAASQTK